MARGAVGGTQVKNTGSRASVDFPLSRSRRCETGLPWGGVTVLKGAQGLRREGEEGAPGPAGHGDSAGALTPRGHGGEESHKIQGAGGGGQRAQARGEKAWTPSPCRCRHLEGLS